jgi:hypothetical protein
VKWLPLRQAVETLSRAHEKVFLTHVGPIALDHVKKQVNKTVRGKARPAMRDGGKRRGRSAPAARVEHVVSMDETTRPNLFVKALGNWIGRRVAHGLARRAS